MKVLKVSLAVSALVMWLGVGVLVSSCERRGDSLFEKKYIVIPSARFVQAQETEPFYPLCTPDYPLYCQDGCCGENYPFLCASQERCYRSQPDTECPEGWEMCIPPEIMITGVSPHDVALSYGESITVSVSFRRWGNVSPQKLIVNVSGIEGEFEQDLTGVESENGFVEMRIVLLSQKPSPDTCTQACSRSGECGPCYVETTLPSWRVRFLLSDGNSATGTLMEWLNLSWEDDTSPAGLQCSDGSECCRWSADCGGGLSCTIVSITVPEECECPSNTTYETTDVNYNVKICSCNDC